MNLAFILNVFIPLAEFAMMFIIAVTAVFEIQDTILYKKLFSKKRRNKKKVKRSKIKNHGSEQRLKIVSGV